MQLRHASPRQLHTIALDHWMGFHAFTPSTLACARSAGECYVPMREEGLNARSRTRQIAAARCTSTTRPPNDFAHPTLGFGYAQAKVGRRNGSPGDRPP